MEEKNNFSPMESSPVSNAKPNKKKILIIISVILAVLFVAAGVLFGIAGCDKTPTKEPLATQDEYSTTGFSVDEASFVFADGIYIGEAAVGGCSYQEARELVKAACDSMIHDFTLTITANDKSFEYTKLNFEWDSNAEEVLLEAAAYSESIEDTTADTSASAAPVKEKNFELTVEVNSGSVDTIISSIATEIDTEPQNASIEAGDDDKVTIISEKAGCQLDKENLRKAILKVIVSLSAGDKESAIIEAVVTEIEPSLTSDDLDGNIVLLASHTTYSYNTEEGTKNMEIALSKCNGSVIAPGETWSFSAHAGNTNSTAAGYLSATVISGGKFTQGIGGGVCQACTTIYGAAIRTNLVIAERHNHYYKSSYADAGLDATIAYPALDLKLKNPTEYPIYLQCYLEGRTLHCDIYGWQDPAYDEVEVHSYIHSENYAQNYYLASAYRVFLKDGKEVMREDLPSSRYHYTSGEVEEEEETTAEATKKPSAKPTKPTKPTKPAVTEPPIETIAPEVVPTAPPAATEVPVEPDPQEPTNAPVADETPTEAVETP